MLYAAGMADDALLRPPTLLSEARRARAEVSAALDAADLMADRVRCLLEAACLDDRCAPPGRRRGAPSDEVEGTARPHEPAGPPRRTSRSQRTCT